MLTEKQHQEWKRDLIELNKLRAENRQLKVALKNSLYTLQENPQIVKACIEQVLKQAEKR